VHVTAKIDYAVRALVELAASDGLPVRAEDIAMSQDIPLGFLRGILTDLRRAELITSQPGASGGFRLARPAGDITIANVFRAIEGPLAEVRGVRPNELTYRGPAAPLRDVWVAVRANLRAVLDHTTIAHVAGDRLPAIVRKLAADPAAWDVVARR
jgi:Rrf2 family protein